MPAPTTAIPFRSSPSRGPAASSTRTSLQSATLGAGCTVKLSLYRAGALVRDLTVATTAGAASYANANTLGPIDALAGDEITIVVGGANVGAAATITADVQLQH
jgi:hypothetical protein